MPSPKEVKKVSLPYLSQAKLSLVVVKISANAATLSGEMLRSVPLTLPIKMVSRKFPALCKVTAKQDSQLKAHKEVLTITPIWKGSHSSLGDDSKTKAKAVIDIRLPVNLSLSS